MINFTKDNMAKISTILSIPVYFTVDTHFLLELPELSW